MQCHKPVSGKARFEHRPHPLLRGSKIVQRDSNCAFPKNVLTFLNLTVTTGNHGEEMQKRMLEREF